MLEVHELLFGIKLNDTLFTPSVEFNDCKNKNPANIGV